ncbi:MAG: serine/threonine protein kinase [Congregibacter sp.]
MLRGLAQYKVLQCLASGSQGKVFLALDTHLSRRVCIKLYKLEGSLGDRRRAVLEAWQLTRVESPLTVNIYDVVAHGKSLALVTRYVPGCTLADLLNTGAALSAAHAVAIASDIATALASLRKAHLVHGDLSARNVLIDLSGRAILTDFGVASWTDEIPLGRSHDSMSPEQSRGDPIDFRSDFFSLGLLFYQMLYGRHPFFRNGAVDTLLLAKGLCGNDTVEELHTGTADPIKALLLSLLAGKAGDRPQSTHELREQLRRLRSLLPAAESLRPLVLAAQAKQPRIDESLRLPIKLVKLPFRHHLRAWLRRYWNSGSLGARGLLLAALAVPTVTLILFALRPGVCLEVEPPQIRASMALREMLPGSDHWHALLTTALKSSTDTALILGKGASSDSRLALTSVGIQDQCTAQRSLSLLIECNDASCLFQTRGRTPEESHFSELTLQLGAGLQAMESAVQQLVQQQAAFLTDA